FFPRSTGRLSAVSAAVSGDFSIGRLHFLDISLTSRAPMLFSWAAIQWHTRTDRVQEPILARYAAAGRRVVELQCPKPHRTPSLVQIPQGAWELEKTGAARKGFDRGWVVKRSMLAQWNPSQDMEKQASLERRESHAHLDA